jgi:hypothetical protein
MSLFIFKINTMIEKLYIKKNFVTFSITLVILLQLLLSFQGFDICDEGCSLSFYQQFFNDPASVEYNFAYWLSGLVGGIWYQLFPTGGILWFRLLAIVVNTATLVIGYKFLSNYCNKYIVIAGLTMSLFINDFGYLLFYHNHLTALIAVISIIVLFKGIINNKLVLIFIAGSLCAINISTRLPNGTLLVFILGIPFYYYIQNRALSKSLLKMLVFCAGVLGGLLLIIIILFSLNQLSIMENSIIGIFDSGSSQESSHNFSSLIRVYKDCLVNIVKVFIKILLVVLPLVIFDKYFNKTKLSKYVLILIGTVAFSYVFWFNNVFSLYSISLCGGFILLIFSKNSDFRLMTLLALLMALFLPFGSDGAMINAGYISLWLLLPLALNFFYSIDDFDFKSIKTGVFLKQYSEQFKIVVIILCFGYFVSKAYKISQEAYFDPGNRFDKTYVVNSEFSRGIYTTKKRADIINGILPELKKHVKPGDYLLAYESLPMLHVLTETKPYLKNPWIMIYDGFIFENKLKQALKASKELPVIIQQKFYTIEDFSEPIEDYLSEVKPEVFNSSKRRNRVMNKFLKDYNYKIVFSNSHFNIYKVK